jgi:hypothetical protein
MVVRGISGRGIWLNLVRGICWSGALCCNQQRILVLPHHFPILRAFSKAQRAGGPRGYFLESDPPAPRVTGDRWSTIYCTIGKYQVIY